VQGPEKVGVCECVFMCVYVCARTHALSVCMCVQACVCVCGVFEFECMYAA
jgi:hypothetical protein